jgi:hypothetical protein
VTAARVTEIDPGFRDSFKLCDLPWFATLGEAEQYIEARANEDRRRMRRAS